ncbi:MAG: hydantoinase/oxoprolinase family protein [Candidatus Bipolaricaulia bacterium]
MRVATDIGGTFTDLVYLDEASGVVGTGKVDTTPPAFEKGVIDVLRKADLDLRSIQFFVHGTTVIINAFTERTGVKTGLITTKGFRDVLEIGRANRPDLYNFYYTKLEPFIPRQLRFEVNERVNYKGEVLTPLDEAEVEEVVAALRDAGVEAIAICFLHSYANPTHEARCLERVRELWPEVSATASYEITKEWREYERTSTVVLNSYVRPIAQKYLDSLETDLRGEGIEGNRYIMQSNGGTTTFSAAKRAPITMVESGPVAGVLGAAVIGKLVGEQNIISLDMGGTTAKCSLIEGGEVKVTTEYRIEQTRISAGYPIQVPVGDIAEIGAGGGSIAWIDEVGSLHVGPNSAGAFPGPACYGRGGEEPTVTDANLLAGRINPAYFLGGEIELDVDRAQKTLEKIAQPLQVDVAEAALGVIRIANANMVNALKLVSLNRGYDPRDFTLVAFGGAGPMHAAALAGELQVSRVLIPVNPSVFSAWGMLVTDLRYDVLQTRIARTDQLSLEELNRSWEELETEARDHFARERIATDQLVFQRYADMRYAGQEHTVKVPIPSGSFDDATVQEIEERFHQLHHQYYTFRLDSPIEFVNFHLTTFGTVEKPEIPELNGDRMPETALKGHREVDFDVHGRQRTPIYERGRLGPGAQVTGPAIVEEPDATTVVFPDQRLSVDRYGNLFIETATEV